MSQEENGDDELVPELIVVSDDGLDAFDTSGFNGTLNSIIDLALYAEHPVFLFFYADWCYFCGLEKPIIDELEAEYVDEVVFIRVDEARNQGELKEFGVDGYPTMLLITGRNPTGYDRRALEGFKDKEVLSRFLSGSEADDPEVAGYAEESVGGLFSHYSCSYWDCVNGCTDAKEINWDDIFTEFAETFAGCVPGTEAVNIPYACTKAMLTEDANDMIGCLGNFADLAGAPLSCAYGAGHLLADILGAQQLGECLGQCAADSGSYGGLCQQGEQKSKCAGDGDLGFVGMDECDECDWVHVPGSVKSCGSGEVCVEGAGGAECKDEEEDDNDDPPKKPPRRPGNDRPDDNYDVSTEWLMSTSAWVSGSGRTPTIAVLDRAYALVRGGLVDTIYSEFGVYPTLVDLDYIQEIDPREYPVLVITSGGLFGLRGSTLIRTGLERYVGLGGTLIVFSQQRGADFSLLPGGDLKGYGWTEDQSCWAKSASVGTYHPIFSDIPSALEIDLLIDGFFTEIPENATTLLVRNKNGMPAMVLYEYGAGHVVATHVFNDIFPSTRGFFSSSPNAPNILRSLFLWALSKKPVSTVPYNEDFPTLYKHNYMNPVIYSPKWSSFNVSETVDILVNVSNPTNYTANVVEFTLIDPYYNISHENVSATVPNNSTVEVNLLHETNNESSQGIWMVLYTLYNDTSSIWYSYGEAFTLGFNISQVSSFKAYLNLTTPNGDLVDNQTLTFDALPSKTYEIGIAFKPNITGIWVLDYEVCTLDNVTVDHGVQAIAVSEYAYNPGGWVYQEDETSFSLTSDSDYYYYGKNGTFTFHIWNRGDTPKDIYIAWSFPQHFWETGDDIYGPSAWINPNLHATLNKTVTVAADGYYAFNYTIPVISRDWLYASFWEDTGTEYRFLSRVSKAFFGQSPRTDTKIHADVDEDYNVTLSLYLKSFTGDDVLNIVNITVEDWTGKIYHQETFSKTLSWKEVYEAEYVFPLTSEYKSDHFYVCAKCQYSTKYYNMTIGHGCSHFEIPQLSLWLAMEKTSYQVGERLEFDLRIVNNPVVPWNQTIEVTVPDIPFMNSTYIEMPADGVQTLHYEVDIPIDATPGDKTIEVVRVEDAKTSYYRYNIPYSRLYARVDVDEASPDETVDISVTNTGGVPTNYTYELSLKDQSSTLLTQGGSDTMQPMETKTIQFTVPTDAVKGDYRIHLFLNNTGAPPQTYDRYYPLWVDGLDASLTAWTDSSVYLSDQEINVTSLIENLDGEISGGTLRLQIYSSTPQQECEGEMCEGPLLTLINSTDIPVDVTGTLMVNTTFQPFLYQPPFPMLGPGRFYLNAELYSSSGQIIDTNGTYFYVKTSKVYVTLDTGRRIFRPNETIPVHVEAFNNESETVYGWLSIFNNGTLIHRIDDYSLDSNNALVAEVDTLSTGNFTLMGSTMTNGTGPFFFDILSVDIEIADPQLNATLNAPDMVGSDPFNATLELENPGRITLELDVDFDGDITHHSIPPGHGELIQKQMAITENKTLPVEITGYVNTTLEANITYGENLSMAISPASFYLEGTVDIPYNFTNDGLMEAIFNATFTLDGEETTTYVDLPPGGNVSNVLLYNLSKGMYFFNYHTPFQEGNFTLNIEAPAEFNVTHLPEGKSFDIGELAEMNITLKNVGGILGGAQVNFTVPGITTQSSWIWLKSGEETNVSFSFPVPDDLEGRSYTSTYSVNETVYPVDFTVQGINISVSASLDKMLYEAGENATLSLTVENLNDLELRLFSRLGLGDHFNATLFNMTSYEMKVIDFDVPVVFDQGKLTYSVYTDSGRALHLNAIYLYEKPDPASGISLYTDKQVYEMGENVTISVNATQAGDLNLTAPSYQNFSSISPGTYEYDFDLPSLRTGTYYIDYDFDGYNGSIPIDVIGYTAIIVDVNLDKSHYTSNDTLEITLTVNTNRAFDGLVKAWVFNPDDQLLGELGKNHTFTAGENSVTITVPLLSNSSGLHWYAFRVYAYGSLISLSTGGGYFDVGDTMPPTITIISPESKTYTSTSLPLTYHVDEPVSWAGYSLDGAANVTLTGNTTLSGLSYSSHNLMLYAMDETGNTGSSSVVFTVTEPPLPDTTPPVITITSPQSKTYTTTSIQLSYTIDEPVSWVGYSIDGAANVTIAGSTTLTSLTISQHTLKVYATDVAGNTGNAEVVFTVTQQSIPPPPSPPLNTPPKAVTLNEPTGIKVSSMKVSWTKSTESDFASYSLYMSTEAGSLGSKIETITDREDASYTVTGLEPSTVYYFTVEVKDTDGLRTMSNQVSGTPLPVDITPPKITVKSPANATYDTSAIDLSWTSDVPLNITGYTLDGGELIHITGNVTLTGLEDGAHIVVFHATDLHSNTAVIAVSFTVNTTPSNSEPPEIFHIPVTAGVEGIAIEIYATISDESGVQVANLYYRRPGEQFTLIEMEKCLGCVDAYSATIPGPAVNTAIIEYYLEASDGINTATDPESGLIQVDVNLYPSKPTLNTPTENDVTSSSVSLSWNSGGDSDLLHIELYVSDASGLLGTLIESVSASDTSATVDGLSPDTGYYFTIRAIEGGGLYTDSNQVGVTTISSFNWTPVTLALLLLVAAGVAYALKKGLIGL